MPNPTLTPTITPTITALARELAERVRLREGRCFYSAKDSCTNTKFKCMYCTARDLLSALASPPVEAAQGEPLPCPFCGSTPIVEDMNGSFLVVCMRGECSANVSSRSGSREATIASWNTRVAAPEARR